ncbi:DUF3325 domain-containing protein [Aquamicrobium lusatiense]|uniref:DUF3325 domain-containing protein n=1 Tax=Aquamicrobium lusatiense TaxID=89772 RepID=UPI002454580C|nr:DUF3325 domain-containing protein [Aquamicrobium lusatiense]MDH4990672.1 DUF3325 domain-containing protein [Aquamicrobium lusatiense]
MTIADTLWLNAAILTVSLTGFSLLALATEKQGPLLLRRAPSAREKIVFRSLGWPLLAVALVLCFWGWGWSIGPVTWLGWLNMAGAALVFAIPYWTEARQKEEHKKKPLPPVRLLPPVRSKIWRAFAGAAILAAPVAFVGLVSAMPGKPVLRDDAIAGQAGPWSFRIAEYDRRGPTFVVQDIPTKAFQIRFCEACDDEIRAAYLKINRPRSLRGAGIVFLQPRWDRYVEIQFPPSTRSDSELWLTVEGKDGSLHYASWKLTEIAPATAHYFAERRQDP